MEADAVLHIRLGADNRSPSVARARLRSWLLGHRWSPAHTVDLVLAVNEAVTACVEQECGLRQGATTGTPPGNTSASIEVHGEMIVAPDGRQYVELTVRHHGGRRSSPPSAATHHHRLTLMRACTQETTTICGANGTAIHLRSHPLPHLDSLSD